MSTSCEPLKTSSFLKWTPPILALKEKLNYEALLQKLIKSPKSLEEKCGDLREVLDCIQAPREWSQDGVIWRQIVSDEPSTRPEVIALTEALDEAIKQSQASETGICEIREAIFCDFFDELIRQTAINCIERGLLLIRIRNEAKDSLRAFKSLYLSGLAYGIRKTLDTDQDITILREEASKLEDQKRILEMELENIMYTIAQREKQLAERMDDISSKQRAEIQSLEDIKTNYKYRLLTITSLNKNKT